MLAGMLDAIGYGLCHQLPERSFFGGGIQVPVCARDTGIYLGFLVSFLVVSLLHRGRRPRDFPPRPVWIVMALMVGAMAWDGVTSYASLRETTNALRLLTGLMTGYAAAALVVPMLNDTMWAHSHSERVLDTPLRVLLWLGSLPLAMLAILAAPRLGAVYPVAVTAAIIATLTAVNMVIVGLFPIFDRRAQRTRDLTGPLLAGVVLAVVEIAAAGVIRVWLEALARSLGT